MRNPVRVGAVRELSVGLPGDPSVLDVEQNHRATPNVLAYLDTGMLVAAGGIARDFLSAERGRVGLQGVRTDGVYIWPEELAYYVREYGVALPVDFLEHVGERARPDRVADSRIDEILAWMRNVNHGSN